MMLVEGPRLVLGPPSHICLQTQLPPGFAIRAPCLYLTVV